MNLQLYFDSETYCETPIKDGLHKYAEGVEIMIAAWALDDPLTETEGPIIVEDWTATGGPSEALLEHLADPDVDIIVQNSMFDRTVARHDGRIDLPVERIHDTMVMALSHGLPGSLDKLCEVFKVPVDLAKDKEGRSLIQFFCKPPAKTAKDKERRTRHTHPVEWARFLSYAGSDISAMRYIHKRIPKWNYPGVPRGNQQYSTERALWLLDQTINDRGMMVDIELAEGALRAVDAHQKVMGDRVFDLTEGEVADAKKRDQLLQHLLKQFGVSLPDMQKSTLERRLNDENLHWIVRELIAIRLDASTTSVSKYKTLRKGVSSDGRLRGTIQFCGAARTGRDAGRLFQPQNLPRPTMDNDEIEYAISAFKTNAADLLLDNPIKAASNAIRGVVVPAPGRKLVVADLSNIEGRVLAWGAGEEWKLKAFKDYDAGIGPDLYKITAAGILKKRPEDVTKDERQSTGKVPELACGFGGAEGAFGTMAALYGLELDPEQVKEIVTGWRATNTNIVNFWYKLDEACRQAILQPGVMTSVGNMAKFHVKDNWLRMKLPSGRFLCYSMPAIVEHPMFENATSISYMGVNSYTRRWERLHTYGGKLAENWTQAVARDVLFENSLLIEEAGFPIIMKVHDETITEPVDSPEFTTDRLCRLLSNTPWWADESLPLSASGAEMMRYAKGD